MSGLSMWQELCFADSAKPSHALQCLKKQGAANRSPAGVREAYLSTASLKPCPAAKAGMVLARILISLDRKSTRLNSSHSQISYAVFCLKKKKKNKHTTTM